MTMSRTTLGLALVLAAAGCKPPTPQSSGASKASADEEAAGLPILIADSETNGEHYLYTTAPSTDVSKIRMCIGITAEQCQADRTQTDPSHQQLNSLQSSGGQYLYASRSFAVRNDTQVTLLALSSTDAVIRSRTFRLMKSDTKIALRSPTEKQVFQRDTVNKGKIVVELDPSSAGNARFLQARVTGTALSNTARANGVWKEAEIATGATRLVLAAPAGGWFSVEAVLLDASRTQLLGRAVVKEVGVGEVFLVAGQSNSTNCGWGATTTTSDFVVSTDGASWQRGDDPQIGVHDDNLCNKENDHGGSNWPTTGAQLQAKYRVPIAFASTGFSGTSIAQWQPGATAPKEDQKGKNLFEYTAARADQLAPGGIRAVLWHQGENDAKDGTKKEDYKTGLTNVIKGIREHTKTDTPWLIAVASWCEVGAYGDEWKGASADVTGAQQEMVSLRVLPELYSGPSTDDLNQTYRGNAANVKDCHFNAAGLKEVGKRWGDRLETFLDAKL
jgi:hypothetical protein